MSFRPNGRSLFLGAVLLNITLAIAADDLDGTWQSACFNWELIGESFEQETFVFDKGSWQSIDRVYSDENCSTASYSDISSGTYSYATNPDNDGLLQIDLTIIRVTEVFHDESLVALLNSNGDYCNGKIVKVDEPVDPLACDDVDASEFALPFTQYELVQIRGDVLLMSDDLTGEGESADTRPTGIDPEDRLNRVSP